MPPAERSSLCYIAGILYPGRNTAAGDVVSVGYPIQPSLRRKPLPVLILSNVFTKSFFWRCKGVKNTLDESKWSERAVARLVTLCGAYTTPFLVICPTCTAVSRHDSSYQLVISRTDINSRVPKVPTLRLIWFLLFVGRVVQCGMHFGLIGRPPIPRTGGS